MSDSAPSSAPRNQLMSQVPTTLRERRAAVGEMPDVSWEDWSAELVRHGGDRYGPRGVIIECGTGPDGRSAWADYYDDGYSPEDALAEDASYADD